MNTINIQTNGNKEASNENVVAGGLSQVLAESYVLYLKTHNFHWNVTGSMFQPLHSVFEGQYTALAEAVDEITERIRALGVLAPGSFFRISVPQFNRRSIRKAQSVGNVKELLDGHETISQTASKVAVIAQEHGDEGTADLMIQRIQEHDKTPWMLRSFLDN